MKFLQAGVLVLAALLLLGCDKASTETAEKSESTPQATEGPSDNSSIASGSENEKDTSKHFLIDVRSQKEWDAGHLETAIHIPHTEIVEGIKNVTNDKDAKICVY